MIIRMILGLIRISMLEMLKGFRIVNLNICSEVSIFEIEAKIIGKFEFIEGFGIM